MRRGLAVLLLAALALCLSGCGGMFDSEYVVESDYTPAPQTGAASGEAVTVETFPQLKRAILSMVSEGKLEGRVTFDQAYSGDATADMASACWELRTQDALCAYCVENIAYDLAQIVTYYGANVYISYSPMTPAAEDIIHMTFSAGLDEVIEQAMDQGQNRLAVLINSSSYSAEDMELLVSQIYRQNPGLAPREPSSSVNLFSGTGRQRLYEINLRYGVSPQEFASRKAEMAALDPFAGLDTASMNAIERAQTACEYLAASCSYEEEEQPSSIYAALVQGRSGSEGMALAYVELCRRLGVNCQIVYGQRNWQDYCWNIVELDGEYYHVDPAMFSVNGLEGAFLLRDEVIWGPYRWDTAAYPACEGPVVSFGPGEEEN